MTEDELNAVVEAKLEAELAARLQADRDRVRAEVREIRRTAEREWYERINRRAPIEGPGDPRVEAERRRQMDLRAKADMESMNRSNSRPIEGSLLDQRSRAGQGFRIKQV
jgi:hypothetical protein